MIILTRRLFGGLVAGAAASFVTTSEASAQAPLQSPAERITLVLTNDLDRMGADAGRGGHPKLAAVVRAERAKGNTLFIHAGDAYSPSILAGFDRGAHIVELLNAIRPDAFAPGNHEFDFGPVEFRARVSESRFPVLAGNVRERDGSPVRGTTDTTVLEVAGYKIGLFGLTTETTPSVSSPGDIRFLPFLERAREMAAALRRDGADLVVAIAHIGLDQDMRLLDSRVADVILSGHDHHLLSFYDRRTVLVESSSQADYVTCVDLTVRRVTAEGRTRVVWTPDFRIIDTLNIAPDPEVQGIVARHEQMLDRELNVAVGTTTTPLDSRRATVRSQEAAIGNLIADAMREAVGADVAITNGGGIRADRQYPAGHVLTRRDLLSEMPFGNKTVLIEVTGAVLRAAIEHGISGIERGAGQFPQVSGLVVEANLTRPAGQRVTSIAVGGRPLETERVYKLATNDFMARGGDGYVMFASARQLIDSLAGQYMAGQVIGHVARAREVSPRVEGRLVLSR